MMGQMNGIFEFGAKLYLSGVVLSLIITVLIFGMYEYVKNHSDKFQDEIDEAEVDIEDEVEEMGKFKSSIMTMLTIVLWPVALLEIIYFIKE